MKQFVQLFENFAENEGANSFSGQVDGSEILNIFNEQGLEAAIAAAKAAGMSKEEFTALVAGTEGSEPVASNPGMQSDDSMNIVDGQ